MSANLAPRRRTVGAIRVGPTTDVTLLARAAAFALVGLAIASASAPAGEVGPPVADSRAAAGIAAFEGEALEVPSPGRIRRAILGGKGRFLLLHVAEEGLVNVFDTSTSTIVGEVPIRMDSLIAATSDHLIVAHPPLQLLECWSLADRKRLKTARCPFPGTVMSMAAGCSGDGPLLVYAVDRRPFWALTNCKTLAPIRIASFKNEGDFRQMELVQGKNGAVIQSTINGWETRAAASGEVFGLWSETRGAGMCALSLDGRSAVHFSGILDRGEYVAPLADGSGICTSNGLYSPDFRGSSHKGFFAPTPDARFFVSLHLVTERGGAAVELSKNVGVMSTEQLTRVAEIEPLPEMTGKVTLGSETIPLDERYLLFPAAKLLVTIPPPENRIVVRRVRWGAPAKTEVVVPPLGKREDS